MERQAVLAQAAAVGETPRVATLSISEWLSRGLLCRVSVHGESVLVRRLNLAELGIDSADKEMQRFLSAGSKSLAPKFSKLVSSWATQNRQLVSKYSLKLDAIDAMLASSAWSLILFDSWAAFKAEYDTLNGWDDSITPAQYAAGLPEGVAISVRQSIILGLRQEWAQVVSEASAFYSELALTSWRRLRAVYPENVLQLGGKLFGPTERPAYVEHVVSTVLAELPAPEALESLIYAEYLTGVLFTEAAALEEEQLRLQNAAAAQAVQRAAVELAERAAAASAQRQAILEAERQRARAALAQAVDPYLEITAKLTAQLAEATRSILAGFEKHGCFRGRTLEPARGFAELYRIMGGAYLNDQELDTLMQNLERALETTEQPSAAQREAWQNQVVADLQHLSAYVETRHTAVSAALVNASRADFIEVE